MPGRISPLALPSSAIAAGGGVIYLLRHAGRASGLLGMAAALLPVMTLSGCVPIPYKPSASVSHVSVTAEEASSISLSATGNGMLASLSKSIRQAEPRVTLVDGTRYAISAGHGTLAEVLAGRNASSSSNDAGDADYLLCVGLPLHRQLHDTGAAAPFVFFPAFWVGYEKIQSRTSLVATLVDLRAPTPADELLVSSTYSEVIASLVYGVGTIAMPQSALRDALAKEVAHTLGAAHPAGAIRLVVMARNGGIAEPEPRNVNEAPRPVMAGAATASR